ncbi:hypothetical protein CSB37_00335, partial [bacterium DOLZORAL124_38_8]
AENVQRLSVATEYINALKRMNASGESFPTYLPSQGNHSVCLGKVGVTCWEDDPGSVYNAAVQKQFDRHIQGMSKIKPVTKSNGYKRGGILYSYPATRHPDWIHHSKLFGMNPEKTAFFDFMMDGANADCDKLSNSSSEVNYDDGRLTYCRIYVENTN